MGMIPGICSQCGATITVDSNKEAMICPYCDTPFVVEHAINNFHNVYNVTNNISAQNVYIQKDGSDFEIVGGVLEKYCGADVNVVIPDNVYKIGPDAFSGTMIRRVSMSNKVIEIDSSFCDCKYLEEIDLPEGLKELKGNVFQGCDSLKNIVLPKSLWVLDEKVFYDCKQLEEIHLSIELLYSGGFNRKCFLKCPKLFRIYVDGRRILVGDPLLTRYFFNSQLAVNLRVTQWNWKESGKCMFCGGELQGVFELRCMNCGRKKNY